MPWPILSRRAMMKAALTTSMYAVPTIVSVVTVREVAAVSPLPSSESGPVTFLPSPRGDAVTFVPSGAGYVGQGAGFPANLPFLFLLSDTDGSLRAMQVIATDGAGSFGITISPAGYTIGGTTAPGAINGGNIFVKLADTFIGAPPQTPTPTSTSTQTPPPISPTMVIPPTRSGPPGIFPATQTAIAAETATTKAKP